ncbi:MAG: SDR family oxidoreductase [Pseudorhodoplanes sp.]|nr:SDR family oxidoreductase [Pseudorhodoplanes sp.]
MNQKRTVAVITGASAGIGEELARVFARHGHRLLLIARRQQRLVALADELEPGGPRPLVLPLDLSEPDAAARISDYLAAENLEPDTIVNNAGYGLLGHASTLDRAEQLRMIDLNCRTLTDLSLSFIEPLARHRGGILNVASVAGFLPGPGMAVYYATKAFVLSFSEALHHELAPQGIRVTALCPGPVPTEFQARAGIHDEHIPRALTVAPARVAEEAYRGLLAGRRVVAPGLFTKFVTQVPRFMPRGALIAATGARQSARRRSVSPAPKVTANPSPKPNS